MFALLSFSLVLLPFVFAAIHDVQVGDNSLLQFSPQAIFANPGDQVVFHFHPKNHTVTQSSLANPCGQKDGGFNSGFHPVPANTTDNLPTFTVAVNDTKPIWVFCDQNAGLSNSHCGAGMVFAINCGSTGNTSFTSFQNSALAIGASLKAGSSSSPYGGAAPAAPAPAAPAPAAPTPTSTPTSSASGNVYKVIVGGSTLAFDPPRVSANPNDIISFEFHQKNHTVTQSSFASPCTPLNANGTTGFTSGFWPVAADATTFPVWNYTVTSTSPVWAFCEQANHCSQGMVFAINSDESSAKTFQAFQNVAKGSSSLAASAAASSSTAASSYGSGSASNKVGSAGWILLVAGLLGAML